MHRSVSKLRSSILAIATGAMCLACGSSESNTDADATSGMVADAGVIIDAALPDAEPPPDADVDASPFPLTLEDTGLYSDFAGEVLAPGVLEYEPAWPLWTDGATKRRWIQLPAGETIDTADMDFWVLPIGTKLWKEFTFGGQRMETRYLWKMGPNDEDWYYMAFAWNAETTEALEAPAGVVDALGTTYDIPRERDCRTCHERQPDFSLGFSAVQLAHQGAGVTLDTLVADTLLTVNPVGVSPYFAVPGVGDEQAVLGYLHGNCGGCHHRDSDVMDTTNLNLRMEVASMDSAADTTAYSTIVGIAPLINIAGTTALIEPQDKDASAIYVRMLARGNNLQMPPKGSEIADTDMLLVLEAWIDSLPIVD